MSNPIGGEFTITREAGEIEVERPVTLAQHLIALSEQTKRCYDAAIEAHRSDVASELVLLANATASLIAKTLRGDLGKAS